MRPLAKLYAIVISIVGIALGISCAFGFFSDIVHAEDVRKEIIRFVIMFFFAYICRCLPIQLNKNFSIDIAFIATFAMLLFKGAEATAAIMLICSPLIVVIAPGPKEKLSHIFNTPPIKTCFNAANYVLSVYIGGQAFLLAGGTVGDLSFPGLIIPALALILAVMLVNSTLLLLLFKLNFGTPFFRTFGKSLSAFLPTVICAVPIGYFIASFLLTEGGEYLVVLFALPLLLARFALSMYIDVKQNYYIMMKTLTNTVEAKDLYTRGHSERVEQYAVIIARQMALSATRINELRTAALLHDVGKIGIEEKILKKPGRLTNEERLHIQQHPEISVNILKDIKLSANIFDYILHHHERYDGLGYPDSLGGGELALEVYILAVADTYDAITSDRPYSKGRPATTARDIILQERGTQFHPDVVDGFAAAFERGLLEVRAKQEGAPLGELNQRSVTA